MTDNNGLLTPTDYKLTALNIITSTGLSLDVINLMVELDIYEDIFSPTMSGSLMLGDSGDIISSMRLHGNEFLAISVDKPGLDRPISKVFRIYKIANRSFGTNALQNYTLHFCSEEMVISSQLLLNKSYKGLSIDTMVKDILQNVLKVDDSKLKDGVFSSTAGSFDLIIPRLQPLEAIEWLTPRAYNTDQNLFFFFENRDGFNFTSYENLLSLPTYNTYSRSVIVDYDPSENFSSFNFVGIMYDFDILKSIRYGAYTSALLSLDLINRKLTLKNFGYASLKGSSTLNDNAPVNQLNNRLGFSLYDSNQCAVKYVISSDIDPSQNPADVQNWMPQTISRLAQLQTFKLIMHIPGDVMVKAGMVVGLLMPKMVVQDSTPSNDDVRSGRYLVSSVHHKFVMDDMTTVVELLSDTVGTALPDADNTSALVQKVVSL